VGDIGPCGDFLEPLGRSRKWNWPRRLPVRPRFLDGGVDGFIIETMSAIEEVLVAAAAVKSVTTNCRYLRHWRMIPQATPPVR
jgi:methionine synthase I (cobalamin-dependent)